MPFIGKGAASAAFTTTTLRVDPDKVLQLKADLQPILDRVNEFLNTKAPGMMMRPLGAELVSIEAADAFNENAQSAVHAARGYVNELQRVLDALDQAAKTYNLVDDTTTQTFRHGVQ